MQEQFLFVFPGMWKLNNYKLQTTNDKLQIIRYKLQTTITNLKQQITNNKLQIIRDRPQCWRAASRPGHPDPLEEGSQIKDLQGVNEQDDDFEDEYEDKDVYNAVDVDNQRPSRCQWPWW